MMKHNWKQITLLVAIFLICVAFSVINMDWFISTSTSHHQPQKPYTSNKTHPVTKYRVVHMSEDLELYIHTAILDPRFNKQLVRIYALEIRDGVNISFKCKWSAFDSSIGADVTHEVDAHAYWIDTSWPNWSPYFAREYDCLLPKENIINSITLSSADSKYNFELPIEHFPQQENRNKVAVCLKPVTNIPKLERFVEWVELQRLSGINDIIMYDSDINGFTRFAVEYYEHLDIVKRISFPYLSRVVGKTEKPGRTGEERYAIYQQLYLLAMHDCLYRFASDYEYIAFIDLDEVILPVKNETVMSLLQRCKETNRVSAGYMLMTAWHFEEGGENMNELNKKLGNILYTQKFTKSTKPADNQPKSIIATDYVITTNFHEILDVPNKELTYEILPWESHGYVHHFRGKCSGKFQPPICKNMLSTLSEDPVIGRYASSLFDRVSKVIDILTK